MSPPFDLPWGSEINAYIVAYNIYGDSVDSAIGNGAKIVTYPDAPINLENDQAATSSTQIGFTWQDGSSDGGTIVLDYQIWI